MVTQDITISVDGAAMAGYLARPAEQSGPHPAVIVLGEVFGFTPEVRRITDLLESIGYVGLAIDYYHRINPRMAAPYTEEGSRQAFAAASNVKAEDLMRDVTAAIHWLNAQPYVKAGKIATWGFGFGGTAALVTSSIQELSGAISFYPANITAPMQPGSAAPIEYATRAAIPLLLVFGQEDYYVSRFDMDRIREALRDASKDVRIQIYPNVGHSFFRHGRPEAVVETQRYSDESVAQAVADAWDLVRVFLRDVFNRSPERANASGDTHTPHTAPLQR
jgi:carboxymethylenebutenolidase